MVDLTSLIRPGDGIVWGQACAEPLALVEALDRLGDALASTRIDGIVTRAKAYAYLHFSTNTADPPAPPAPIHVAPAPTVRVPTAVSRPPEPAAAPHPDLAALPALVRLALSEATWQEIRRYADDTLSHHADVTPRQAKDVADAIA